MTTDILTHVEAGVMTITLNRLDRKNSITSAMYAAMADALATAEKDAGVRVAVLQGHETVLSAGNDIGDFLNKPPAGVDSPVFRFLRGIAGFPKPLVAAVCGPAVGVGTTMLLHCDLVYAGDNAAFSMPFVRSCRHSRPARPPAGLARAGCRRSRRSGCGAWWCGSGCNRRT